MPFSIPPHAGDIGTRLDPYYFSPGTIKVLGERVGSLWAIGYWQGKEYRYEREKLGAEWVRVS